MPEKNQARVQWYDGSSWNSVNLNHYVHFSSIGKSYQRLKFYFDKRDYGDFDGEDYIRLQIYDYYPDVDAEEWRTWFIGKAKSSGSFEEEGQIVCEVKGIGHELRSKKIDLSGSNDLSNTDNFSVIQETVSGETFLGDGFEVIDSGATKTSIDNYSTNEERSRTWKEMENNYDWSLYFEPDKTSSGNYEVRYEPRGYYKSGELIDTSFENAEMKKWEDGIVKPGAVVNHVRVKGVDSSGAEHTGKAEDYSEVSEEYFRRYNVGYVSTDTECDEIANNRLRPYKNTNGKVQVNWYQSNLVNETIALYDDNRNIGWSWDVQDVDTANDWFKVSGDQTDKIDSDGNDVVNVMYSTGNNGFYSVDSVSYNSTDDLTQINVSEDVSDSTADGEVHKGEHYLVKKQVNYYPEKKSTLYLGDIDDEGDTLAREGRELREERAQLLKKSLTNVGDQNVSGDADNHDHSDGTYGADNHDHNDGTYGADNHDHGDGGYGADNHDHGEGNYETDANTSLSEDSDAGNYKDNYFNVLDVDNTQWYSLATLDVPDPRPAYVFGIIDITDIQGDDEWQFAISLDGSYDIIVDRVNSLDWNDYAPEGTSSNYLMSYYLPASSLFGGYTLRLYARCITGTNDIEGYFRLQWDNHVHSLPATAVKSGTSSGNTEPGVSGNSGNTEPGVSGNSGSTEPGVAGDSGSTQPSISGSTDTNELDLLDEEKDDR